MKYFFYNMTVYGRRGAIQLAAMEPAPENTGVVTTAWGIFHGEWFEPEAVISTTNLPEGFILDRYIVNTFMEVPLEQAVLIDPTILGGK